MRRVKISPTEGRVQIPLTVEDIKFFGKVTKPLLNANGLNIINKAPTPKINGLKEGEPVFISINPKDVLLYELEAVEVYPEIKEAILNA